MRNNLLSILLLVFAELLFCYPATTQNIVTGAEQINSYINLLNNKKVAFCGNQTSVVGTVSLVDTLLSKNVNIVKIFCPEHGFRGEAEAGAKINSSIDNKTGIPIVSLYGNNKKPTPEQLENVDIILFDIQDVGCRFYTYISTLHFVMEAAAENAIPVCLLDRPNPNGYFIDGPVLEKQQSSFVGMHPVPVVYGLTIGEYAEMINGEKWLANNATCSLTVIKLQNYTHLTRYVLPVSPSPNLTSPEAIYLYPSLCLFEGTAISVGRGTENPFTKYGHPHLKNSAFSFIPKPIKNVSENPPLKELLCKGTDLFFLAKNNLNKDNKIYLSFIIDAYDNFPKDEIFFTNSSFFDKLAGNSSLRQQIINKESEESIRKSWQKDLDDFKNIRKKYLFYPEF